MTPYYQQDGITIYHGDCRDILPTFPDKSFDLVLTDPPYGIGVNKMTLGSGRHRFFRGSNWDESTPDIKSILDCAEEVGIWGGNYFSLPITDKWLVWHKMNDGLSFSEAELAWTNFSPRVRVFSKYVAGREKCHPTEKPIELMRWCISFSKTVGTVFDPFMGSGTTLVAAKQLGRKAVGIEIEEKYCEIAVKRLSQMELTFAPKTK